MMPDNNQIVRERFAEILKRMETLVGGGEPTTVLLQALCNGCGKFFDPEETDFTFWQLGPMGTDTDFCPSCWR